MNNHPEPSQPKQIQFNANPFSLAFDAMSRAFKINQNPAIVIIIGAIIIAVGNQIFGNLPDFLTKVGEGSGSKDTELALGVVGFVFSLVFLVISTVVGTIWAGFVAFVGLKNAQHESTQVQPSLRTALSKFWTIFGVNFMVGLYALACLMPSIILLLVGIALLAGNLDGVAVGVFIATGILFIVGLVFSIRISIARSLSIFAMFDENLGVFPAMKRSVELTKTRVMEAWGMAFPGAIIPIIGPLLTTCALGSHYLQLKVYRDNSAELPKVHILSWLPLIGLGLLLIVIFLIGATLGALYASV